MKILFSSEAFLPSTTGTAYFLYHMAGKLTKKGHKIYIISPSQSSKIERHTLNNGIKIFGIPSYGLPIYPGFRYPLPFRVRKYVSKYMKEIDPDVVHIQHHFPIGKTVAKIAHEMSIATVGTNHFMPNFLESFLHIPGFLHDPFNKYAWNQVTSVYKRLDFVTSPTLIASNVLKEAGFPNEVFPISNGINLDKYNNKNRRRDIHNKYKLPNKKIILFVGRVDPEKKIDILVKAVARLINNYNVYLVVAGQGALKDKLEELVKRLGIQKSVLFTGFVSDSDLPSLYRESDLFVMPGDAELQSIATLEAVASGLPVVAANAVALPELVKDGVNGYLFEPGNSTMLAEKIEKILFTKGLAKKMGKESIKIAQKHDINLTALEFENLYQKAIAINTKKQKEIQSVPFYVSRSFVLKFALFVFLLIIFFRNSLASPSLAHAKESMKNKFMHSKMVHKIEALDLKIKEKFSDDE